MTTHNTPKRKNSGISIDRALKLRNRLQTRIGDLMMRARVYRMTHEQITDSWRKDILSSKEWNQTPMWVHSYLDGYYQAKRDAIYQYHLVWLLWLDGSLVSREMVDDKTAVEKREGYDKEPIYRSPWARIDNDKSRHVWLDQQGNARADSPYDAKWKGV